MMNVIFFFGAKNKNGEFSSHYVREFVVNGNKFSCVEQFMMAQKALIFRDFETFNKIMNASDPAEMKRLGAEVKGFNKTRWAAVREKVVKRAVYAKFSQNWDLKKMLLETGDALIAESNPTDKVWGIGFCKSYSEEVEIDGVVKTLNVEDVKEKWGENKLGKILMEVREELKNEASNNELKEVCVVIEERKSNKMAELKEIPTQKIMSVEDVEGFVAGKKCKVRKEMIGDQKKVELYCDVFRDLNYGKEKLEENWVKVGSEKIGEFVSEVEACKFAKKYKMSGVKRAGKRLSPRMISVEI